MTTVDQFMGALAVVESSNNDHAWGDDGRALGRWQVHPDRLWSEMHRHTITPQLGETWDHLVWRVLLAIFFEFTGKYCAVWIAMYWHVGHMCAATDDDWDLRYAARFRAALLNVKENVT